MRTAGFPYAFHPADWDEISGFLGGMAERYPQFEHMAAIVRSVIDSQTTGQLAALTSMHDLMVTAVPVGEPPVDLVAVRAPGSVHEPRPGQVLIEHLTVTGRNDRI